MAGKRVVIIGDLHCGHFAGLTPPAWRAAPAYPKLRAMQARAWREYQAIIRRLGRVHLVVVNGDMIDGQGTKSGGTEEDHISPEAQQEMAFAGITQWQPAAGFVCTYGTAYHTGVATDYEKPIADKLCAPISGHEWPCVEGVTFDCKHHVGSSAVPHGRHTAMAGQRLWNLLWTEQGEQPRAQVYCRSHVHYHNFCGGPGWLAMTLPALQQAATKFGRRCSGTVDWGVTWFDCDNKRVTQWQAEITRWLAPASVRQF